MIVLVVPAGLEAASLVTAVQAIASAHPGSEKLVLRSGDRKVELGPAWRYAPSPACLDALAEFGSVVINQQRR